MVSVGHNRKCMVCSAQNEVPEESWKVERNISMEEWQWGETDTTQVWRHKASWGKVGECSPPDRSWGLPLERQLAWGNPHRNSSLLVWFPSGFPLWPDPCTEVLEPMQVVHKENLSKGSPGVESWVALWRRKLEMAAQMGIRKQFSWQSRVSSPPSICWLVHSIPNGVDRYFMKSKICASLSSVWLLFSSCLLSMSPAPFFT